MTRGESEASFSAASTVSSQREEELLETEEAAVAAPEPVPAAGSMDAAASGPTQKKKRFWRRLFRGRKHKQKHKQKAAAAAAARASPQPLAWAASSGGGGGKGWAAMMGKQQRQQQQQSALPPSPQRLPYLPPTAPIVTAASSAPMTAPAAASNPLSPYPITRHDAALWNLLWTLPLLVLGFLLVRAAVSPLVHAYAGAAGEALVLAVLLQHATALLARQGLLPAAVRVTLRCQLPTLVLAGSLALAALLCVLGGAWDRRMGARVRAANSGLFLLLLGLVVVGQWRAAKAEQGRSDGQSGDRMASVRA